MRVVVLVCTFRRPAMLTRLLAQVDAIRNRAIGFSLTCAVVDDDPDASARAAVDAAKISHPLLEVEYVHLGARDISVARNTAVEVGLKRADWLVFIDDDCTPDLDWIDQLISVQRLTDADFVTSGVHYFVAPGSPAWLGEQGFLDDVNVYDDESTPQFGCMANVMLSARWLSDHPEIRFDTTFGRTGGEDMIFLRSATDAGARMRWAAKAHVAEELPAARANMRYLAYRRFWFGNNNVMIHLRGGWMGRPRMAVRVIRKWARWIGSAVVDPIAGRPFHGRARLAMLAEITGMTVGLVGFEAHHR